MTSDFVKLRPIEGTAPQDGALEGAFRVHVAQNELKERGLVIGDFCLLATEDTRRWGSGVVWPTANTTGKNNAVHAKVSELFRSHYGLTLQDRLTITKSEDRRLHADAIYVSRVDDARPSISAESTKFFVTYALSKFQHLYTKAGDKG